MTTITNIVRRYASRIVAILLILALYGLARLPELSYAERARLAAGFKFVQTPLPELMGRSSRSVRAVHPGLSHISGWISSVGASVALNDIDGDGLPNDVCYVDTRTDRVIVAPVPGTPARYQPFTLDPKLIPYDEATMAPMGCLPNDLNEDGSMDVLVYYWGRTPIAFLNTKPDAASRQVLSTDSYVAREVIPTGGRWYTNAATLADLDGDGHADLIVGNYFQDDAQILDANALGSQQQMQHSMSRASNGGRNRLLLWSGATSGAEPSVQFKDVQGILDEQVARSWTLAVGAADLDGDLLPEIYFANDFGPDRLLHNRSKPGALQFVLLEGAKTLTTPSSKVLGRDSFKGMGVDFGDLNGDGLLDIYVSNIADEYALEESHFVFLSTGATDLMKQGVAPYVDASESLGLSRSGWGWDTRLGDFNNDGILEALQATGFMRGAVNRWPELHELALGNDQLLHDPRSWPRFQPGDDLSGHNHNPFFVRAQDGRYYDLAKELGLDQLQVSRGIATADVDGDGRLDFAVANQWDTSYFYHNESAHAGVFLGLHLLLPLHLEKTAKTSVHFGHPGIYLTGRPAIGAFATVYLPDGRRLVAQVDGGNGHSGKRSTHLHFGLGQLSSNQTSRVELRWRAPDGQIHHDTLQLSPGWYTVLLGR